MSGASTGAVGGAATGAATGFQYGGWYGAIAGGVIGGIGGYLSGDSADDQFSNQQAWAAYNNQATLVNAQNNINAATSAAFMNASLSLQAASSQAAQIAASTQYNVATIAQATAYNTSLLEDQLERGWEAMDLDLSQLELFRARERGDIVADQSASGTVIGTGSNEDVVVSQMAQEALDASVIVHNADTVAAHINNEIAKGKWQGEVAIKQTLWDGQLASFNAVNGAKLQAMSNVAASSLDAQSSLFSAKQGFLAGVQGAGQAASQFNAQNQQNMNAGLFGAASTTAGNYSGGGGSGGVVHADGSQTAWVSGGLN